MKTNCAWGFFLARSQETKGKLLMDNSTATQTHQQRTITISFSPITPTYATSQSRATKMGSQPRHNKGVTINRLGNSKLSCTKAPTPWTMILPSFPSTDKGHYLLQSQVLSSLRRPLHSGSTYSRDLSKTKVTIYLP